jgi:hypothetical protein
LNTIGAFGRGERTRGFKNVLALRAELERKAGTEVPPPERYVDLGYYERAMRLVGR